MRWISKKALNAMGAERQMAKASLESLELSAAITRYQNHDTDKYRKSVIEQVANLEIMCDQLREILGDSAIDECKHDKLMHLAQNLTDYAQASAE